LIKRKKFEKMQLQLLIIATSILILAQGFQPKFAKVKSYSLTKLSNPNAVGSSFTPNIRPFQPAMSSQQADLAKPKHSKLWDAYLKTTDTLTTLFPLWTVIFAGLALYRPSTFSWFSTKYFTASLGKDHKYHAH
jgi:hypothetical protein